MELYFVEMIGVAFFSLLFYAYMLISKHEDYTLRFISLYFTVFFFFFFIIQYVLNDPSFFQMISKCCFPLLFVALYPFFAKHKLSRKEINMLIFISAIGVIPFLMDWFTILAFCFSGNNM